jgi:hypothetical protein
MGELIDRPRPIQATDAGVFFNPPLAIIREEHQH